MSGGIVSGLSGPQPSQFVQEDAMTVAQLHSLYPPTMANQYKYARVSDLFSEAGSQYMGGIVLNETGAGWTPVRPFRVNNVTFNGNQALTFTPLLTPPVIELTGTLSANRTYSLSTLYAVNGSNFIIKNSMTLGLFGINLSGLTNLLGLLSGSTTQVYYNGSIWKQA